MNIVCVLPSECNARSNGIMTLISIYKCLLKMAPSRTIFICGESSKSAVDHYKNVFGRNLRVYEPHDKCKLINILIANQFVLVRPDDLEGINNDIHWELAGSASSIRIVNILLAPPYAFARKVSILSYYGKKDLFLLANQAVMPAFAGMESHDLFVEQPLDPAIWDFVNLQKRPVSAPISIYIGKGVFPVMPSFFRALGFESALLAKQGIVLIKRSWPTSKSKLYSILASSRCLISCDPFSHIERVSTCLGTPVIKFCGYNLRELPGVAVLHDSLDICLNMLPSPAEVYARSFDHFNSTLIASQQSLSRIVEAILKAATPCSSTALKIKPFIPYDDRCMLAFSSQLRLLLPHIADFKTAFYSEFVDASDFLDIVTSFKESSSLTASKLAYVRMLKRSRPPQSRFIPRKGLFQYARLISPDR